ncbi:MAG: hypothetical protein JKY01_04700 [Pseudomonadales bacterium]|nr:hypothetical protein [Pseudomonadales bacterium]
MIDSNVLGGIDGGAGNDILNVNLTGTESGQVKFSGGSDSTGDTIQINGGMGEYSAVYTINENGSAKMDYTHAENNYRVIYESTETVRDNVVANSLSIMGGEQDDTISLGTGNFSMNGLTTVNYSNKTSLVVAGGLGNDTIDIVSNITMPSGPISLRAETISNGSSSVISAPALYLESVGSAGSENARLRTNIDNLFIVNSEGVYIDEINAINIAQLDHSGVIAIRAASITDSAPLVSDGELTLEAVNGDVALDAENRLGGRLNLIASGNVTIKNVIDTQLGDINTKNLTVDVQGDVKGLGGINVSAMTRLTAAGHNISLMGDNDFSTVQITAANSATINDINHLLIENSTVDDSLVISANNLSASNLRAGKSLNLNAGSGSLVGAGLTAPRIELRANSGIADGVNALTTQTSTLVAENTSGKVDIKNTGVVTLESLKNSGDINFNNDVDIYFESGSVDAGFSVGTLFLKTETGSFLGAGDADTNNPDITAYAGIFFGLQGTFGTIDRPLVINIQDSVLINARSSLNPIFYPNQPRIVDDRSLLQFSAFDALDTLSGGQLVEVETLAEINPAIFTDVRNYASSEIAIRMPRDQMYEEELEEE